MQDGDLRSQLVGKLVELPTAGDGHQDAAGTLFDGNFHGRYWIVDWLDRSSQVEATDDDGSPLMLF
jgi:hypothetical protein